MKRQEKTTKTCKHCWSEIPYRAKVCPQCRKRVKGGVIRWILLSFVLIIIISAIVGSRNDDKPEAIEPVSVSPSETATPTISNNTDMVDLPPTSTPLPDPPNNDIPAPAPEVKDTYCVGDIIQDGNMKIIYMSSGEYVEENPYLQPEEGYKYVFLEFAFENTSEKADEYISLYNFVGYADGYAVDMYFGGNEGLSATLSPGRTTTGYIYFSVPKNAMNIDIEYETSFFTEDKITFVYEGEKDSGLVFETDATPSEDAYPVGSIVESKGLRIVYLSCSEYISDNMFIQPKDGYHFITCTFEFENFGDSDEYITSFDFDCYADGSNCAAVYIREDDLSATLSSGRKTKGTVTFEVPIDAVTIEVEYLSNYWASNRVVFTAN